MAVKTPDTKDEQDSAYNPSEAHAAEQFTGAAASAGIDQAEAFANDPANASNKVKGAEDNPKELSSPLEIPFTGGGAEPKKQPVVMRLFGSAKKNSAVTAIIGLLLTGAFGLTLLSPGLLIVQLKETLTDKFNDQLTAMNFRQTAILKKKLSTTTLNGACGSVITIRCRYKTLGDRHVERLRKAGIDVNGDKNAFGRTKPTSFTFDGNDIKATELLGEARSSPALRSAMRHGYNPKFAAFSDAIAEKVRVKFGLKKTKNITPSADEEKMKQQVVDNASGKSAAGSGRPRAETTEDADGNKTTRYYDANGDELPNKEAYDIINEANSEIENRSKLAGDIKKTALKSGLKGALTATALGAGAADTLCTAWTVIRVASFAAKVYGARQLIRYSYIFMNTADSIKAGDATPEEVAYLGKILTSVNSVGKSATDSDGYKLAAYGDTFNPASFDTSVEGTSLTDAAVDKNVIQNETSKYVNGQIIPSNVMAKLVAATGKSDVSGADSFCKVEKSWKGQAIVFTLAIAGVVAAVVTGGVSLGVGTVLQAAAGITASVAFALITPKLVDMAKGEIIDGGENGNQAGNAIVSGRGASNDQESQARGLPVLNKQDAVEYAQATEATIADYNEVDRYEHSPFDPTSKNTFVGSIVNSLLPYTSKMSSGGASLTSMASLVTQSFGNILTPKTNAADTKASEFDSCDDPEYQSLAADPFCNLRRGLSQEALATDPEAVLDYMEAGGYIEKDSEDGAPGGINGAVYQEYIDQCIERDASIGDNLSPGDEGNGDNCIQGKGGADEKRNMMFRLMYIDVSIQDGMDSDFGGVSSSLANTGSAFRVASFNVLGKSHTDGPGDDKPDFPTWSERIKTSLDVIVTNNLDVIAFQEFEPEQRAYLKENLPNYGQSDHGKTSDSIMWNTDRFKLIDKGTSQTVYFEGPIQEPWVMLEDNDTGQKFYVLSVHDPINKRQGSAQTRYENALVHKALVEKLQEQAPVLLVGDFNSAYTTDGGAGASSNEKLTYCVIAVNGPMNDAYDLSVPRKEKCPNKPPDGVRNFIDHIYVSPEIQVDSSKEPFKEIGSGPTSNGSDHPTIFSDVVIPAGSASDGELNVGTYNVRTSNLNNEVFGDPNMEYDAGDEQRMKGVAGTISSRQLKIVGAQEVRGNERRGLVTYLPDYYEGTEVMGTRHELESMVFWDNRYFKKVDFGTYTIPKNPGVLREGMWVKLQSLNTGGEVYVFNMHTSTANDALRAEAANILLREMDRLVGSSGTPVIIMGDMNSNDIAADRNGVYETFKASGKLIYTRNAAKQKINVNCDTQSGPEDGRQDCRGRGTTGSHLDQIWISKDSNIKVNTWENIATAEMLKYSDHNPVIVNLTAPSLLQPATGGGSSKGWVWPTSGPITNGPCYGVSSRLGNHAGMDINTPSTNLKVMAMHDGTVEQKGSDSAAGNYIMIKATDGTYYAYQHLKSIPTVSGAVTAGQEIGIAGKTGNVFLQSSAAHLHITMATRATLGSYSGHPDNFDPMTKLSAVKPGGYNCTK